MVWEYTLAINKEFPSLSTSVTPHHLPNAPLKKIEA
ncbi:hypothetical protein SLEP1_g18538 [Rubroshorea leprosula]|uniref:Uncharacterized protein n=1 Tax=Rubroshorea leprosula TaxID=152421 RepID=A0AAV5J3D6_9ROSI|nr:hypothetical protein SLEP1_g18538 [Rubroshorea leprosula]